METPRLPPLLKAMRALQSVLDEYDVANSVRAGLGRSDWRCLEYLVENGEARPGSIQQALGLTSGSVTALLDRLERRKLIVRSADRFDRRAVVVSPSEAAVGLLTAGLEPLAHVTEKLCDRIGEERSAVQARQLADCVRLVEWAGARQA